MKLESNYISCVFNDSPPNTLVSDPGNVLLGVNKGDSFGFSPTLRVNTNDLVSNFKVEIQINIPASLNIGNHPANAKIVDRHPFVMSFMIQVCEG